jgi:SAM-dependent methyltransferase
VRFASLLRVCRELADPAYRSHAVQAIRQYRKTAPAECSICGYVGKFDGVGTIMRFGSGCPACHSAERHRLLAIAADRGFVDFGGKDILHFAPEPCITRIVKARKPRSYTTGDIQPGRADRVLNIEKIDMPDASLDMIICSHVLEHVDDAKALGEFRRILRPGGQAVLMVPIVEGWDASYENPQADTDEERFRHYGQADHIRYYGSDFRNRVTAAGFALGEFTANGPDSVRYALSRGEKVFLATSPQPLAH